MTTRALRLFGAMELALDGIPVVRFHSDKVRALLGFLATDSDRPHSRAALAALLWPEQGDAAARRNLSQTLVRLRAVLGDTGVGSPLLEITWQTIHWRTDAAAVDAADFVRLARSAEPDDLARAVALYRGEFCAGFGLPGCEAFEEWLRLRREQFQQQALAAANRLAEYHLAAQCWAEAAVAAQRQLEIDRWREDAHRQLMRARSGAGDRAAALAAYERCVQILHDDLGIAPDGETTALVDVLRVGRIGAASSPAPARQAAGVELPVQQPALPAPLTPLVGRADELATIDTVLRGGATRLVTIVGLGGAGKTRLALAAGWTLREAFADGAGWVPLAGVAPGPDSGRQYDALAAAVGVALGLAFDGRHAPIDELSSVVHGRALLLILDNCEHVPAVATFVRDLLTAAPGLRVLATSRIKLDVAGEVLVRLDGLPVPPAGVNDPADYAGVQLFLAQAQRHVPSFGRDSTELGAVVRLCRLLDGLPLGIELAARWVGHYTCDEIAGEIQADLDFLAVHAGDSSGRHHSLRAAFTYSWAMLRDSERQALARLAIFRGSFDRAAAQAVAATRVTALASLVDASLLRHLGVGRYGFHEQVRQFAAARLVELGKTELLAERHAAYYLDLLARHEALLYGDDIHTAAADIRAAVDNIRQAWSWAVAHNAWDGIARSLPALRRYALFDGLFYENALRVAEAAEHIAAQVASRRAGREQAVLLGRLRATEAFFLERQEASEPAIAAARSATTTAAEAGDAIGEAYGYLQLSNATVPYIASLASPEAEPAVHWLERAIVLCRAVRDQSPGERRFATEVEADCLLKLSTIRIELRDYMNACSLAEQALALAQTNGDRFQQARAHSFFAMALENAGRYEASYERRLVMLALARANGSRPQEHIALNNLACTLLYLGDYQRALEYARAAIRVLDTWMRNPYENADSYHTLSWVACRAGETELALDFARQALAFAQATSSPQNRTLPLLALGDALFDLGRHEEALAAYHEALAIGREHRMPQPVTVALAGIARCRLAQEAHAEALAAVDELLHGTEMLTLGSLWEPLRVAVTCYGVLRSIEDPRATGVLRDARVLLEQQAAAITDPARRDMFRAQVAAHRTILEAAAPAIIASAP